MKAYLLSLVRDERNDFFSRCVKLFLGCLAQIYRLVAALRNNFFDRGLLKTERLNRPVISVGNITMGGVGKTPLVIWIAQYVLEKGYTPVVLTRGYMDAKEDKGKSDEVKLLEDKVSGLKVLVGPKRTEIAKKFLASNDCDLFILDDGFQRRQLHRDLDIVVVDTLNPFGNKKLIPRGILRESLRQLKRSDLVVLSRSDLVGDDLAALKQDIHLHNSAVPILESGHNPVQFVDVYSHQIYALSELSGKAVLSFCAIGNPLAFKKTLRRMNMKVVRQLEFVDHYSYDSTDMSDIIEKCQAADVQVIVTTEKDAVKLKDLNVVIPDHVMLVYLDINLEISHGKNDISKRIDALLLR